MNELAAIQKHLGVCTTESQLNHYTLIGVSQSATQLEIKQALKNAIASWNRSDKASDPESAQHVAKLIKQAQGVLLDEVKKKEYDQSLNAKAVSTSKKFFPDSDPFAAFDPSQYLVGVGHPSLILSYGSIEERWDELSRQIQVLKDPMSGHSNPVAAAVTSLTLESLEPVGLSSASSASLENASARIERLKRIRRKKQGLYLATFAFLALVFLGFAGILFVRNRQQVAQQNLANAAEEKKAEGLVKPKETPPKAIGGKNAPKGNASESTFVLPTLSKEDSTAEPVGGVSMEPTEGAAPMELPITQAPPMKPKETTEPIPPMSATPVPMIPDPSMNPAPSMKPESPLTPAAEKPMDAMPTAASKAEWVSAMKNAREAVEKADFKTFTQQIELALPLSTNDEMSTKRARLDQLGQLYEISIKAMQEAKKKMKGSEALTVGKTVVSIVEVKENEIILRKDGKNERYPWDRLPPGIANAMADFALSDSEPIDIAARAVYFSLSPSKNELFAKRVKDWFEKSVGKGQVRQDLVQALTDTYE
jgi:curved DNA-binding protein CbpA